MMTPVEALEYAVVIAAACAYLIWRLPGPCVCKDCPTHTREREERERQKAEDLHNVNHKGIAYKDSWPDRFECGDKACARNPKRVD